MEINIKNKYLLDNMHLLIDNVWFHDEHQLFTALLAQELKARGVLDISSDLLATLYESRQYNTKNIRKHKVVDNLDEL